MVEREEETGRERRERREAKERECSLTLNRGDSSFQ